MASLYTMAQMNVVSGAKLAKNANPNGTYLVPLILVTSLFFMWGVANNLNDILIKQFQKAFELTDFQSGLVQSAFYFGYFVLAIPAALFMRKYSYKAAILLGLSLYATGAFLFYPAAEMQSYTFFLMALFVIAAGLAFLETAANPFVAALGNPETSAFRLNLAQSFNPIGSIAGILIGQQFIFSGVEYSKEELAKLSSTELSNYYASEATAVQAPYLLIGIIVVLFVVFIALTKFPAIEAEEEEVTEHVSILSLLGIKHFRLAVITQFFYVGAQVGIWSYLIRYAQNAVPNMSEKEAASYLTYSLVVFMCGRFGSLCSDLYCFGVSRHFSSFNGWYLGLSNCEFLYVCHVPDGILFGLRRLRKWYQTRFIVIDYGDYWWSSINGSDGASF